MQLFREAVDGCGFINLGFVGSQFTWEKHFVDGHSIWERLNRALANNVISFDHSPLWIMPKSLELP